MHELNRAMFNKIYYTLQLTKSSLTSVFGFRTTDSGPQLCGPFLFSTAQSNIFYKMFLSKGKESLTSSLKQLKATVRA